MSHARLSPSAAYRWSECTASVLAIEAARRSGQIPQDESNDAADEGTAAHAVREDCLKLGLPAKAFIGTLVRINGKDWEVTREMADFLQIGIDWINERVDRGLMEPLVETRVKLDPFLPGQFGTVDLAFLYRDVEGNLVLCLSDLKYGFGDVDPYNNKQQMIYALGVLTSMSIFGAGVIDAVEIVIDQPRKGGIKTWRTTQTELLEFEAWIGQRGQEALSGEGVFRPGQDTCKFCPLYESCDARRDLILSAFEDLAELDVNPPALRRGLTDDMKSYFVLNKSLLVGFLDEIQREVYHRVMAGEDFRGIKPVKGREGPRKWANPELAAAHLEYLLGSGAYSKVPLSPTEAEKAKKVNANRTSPVWAILENLVTRNPAKPILVPSDDRRPIYRPVDAEFDEME